MDDIVEKLRRIARGVIGVDQDRLEAADEIERLREALKTIADDDSLRTAADCAAYADAALKTGK